MLIEHRIPTRYLFQKCGRSLVAVFLIASAITALEHSLPHTAPVIPLAIPTFLGTAISLLLSFKLAQSYDRWWEARKIWGAIVNDSRTLTRQLLTFAPSESACVRRMGRRQIAWCYCLGQSLRSQDWRKHVIEHLSDKDVAEAEKHANKPLLLLQQQARDLATLRDHLTDYQRVALDGTLTRLTDSMGKAERIRNTVFPRTYRVFLRFFLFQFLTSLSFALESVQGGWQVVITGLISVPFILLERTATHMQDPFANRPTDTAVTSIARTIHINLAQLLGEDDVPQPLAAADYYLM